jgi:diguanylate cyclase (GGDEF)-like protein
MIIPEGSPPRGKGIMRPTELTAGPAPDKLFAWLVEAPQCSDRAMRMESLVARLRLVVLTVNSLLLLFLLDTRGMHMNLAWGLMAFSFLYGIPLAVLQPFRRWRLFQMSLFSAALDSLACAIFIGATGGADSPFYLLFVLSATAIALRFDLRQAVVSCLVYAFTYAIVFLATWHGSTNEMGELLMRVAYMLIISVGVGQLAREEKARSRQVEVIERLNAENAKLLSKNERAARIDKLTGLLNRGYMEKTAQKELRRAKSSTGYLSVLFCDMDRLKRINDELGHDIGDRVLRTVATALRQKLRSQDFIGRYGGDEFVALLPNVTRETAIDRAEALVAALGGVNETLPDDLQVGLSVGVATFPFDAQDYSTLVKIADQAMYLAKREGGNRVRTSNDLRLFWEEMPRAS